MMMILKRSQFNKNISLEKGIEIKKIIPKKKTLVAHFINFFSKIISIFKNNKVTLN